MFLHCIIKLFRPEREGVLFQIQPAAVDVTQCLECCISFVPVKHHIHDMLFVYKWLTIFHTEFWSYGAFSQKHVDLLSWDLGHLPIPWVLCTGDQSLGQDMLALPRHLHDNLASSYRSVHSLVNQFLISYKKYLEQRQTTQNAKSATYLNSITKAQLTMFALFHTVCMQESFFTIIQWYKTETERKQ